MCIKYLILGSGIAGVCAAEAIRHSDASGEIIMLTAQLNHAYLRPLLSKTLLNQASIHFYQMTNLNWAQQLKIKLIYGCEVLSINPIAHYIVTSCGRLEYDRCIYALGGQALIPPIEGVELDGVFVVRTIYDILSLKRQASQGGRAVIIGGGVIGMEAADVLSQYSMKVTLLEAMPHLMSRVLDYTTATVYQARLRHYQIETNVSLQALEGNRQVDAVCLDDGRRYPCDLVVFSCGVRPIIQLAQNAGVAVERRGVLVDSQMRTSASDLFACGDCAIFEEENSALWKRAQEQGHVAGTTAAGGTAQYHKTSYPILFTGQKISLFAHGDLARQETGYEIKTRILMPDNRFRVMPRMGETYERKVYREGRLVGAALVGNLYGMSDLQRNICLE